MAYCLTAYEEERRRDNPAYYGYFNSEVWREKRMQRLKLDGFQCQMCGTAKNLRVHHITYENFGHEAMEDLITLCDNCHSKAHAKDLQELNRDNPKEA